MKKVSILSLHLGYGGAEKSIINLANYLIYNYKVELICVYKLYDKLPFLLDDRVEVKYLIKEKPNKEKLIEAFRDMKIISLFKEVLFSIKVLYKKRKYMKKAIKEIDSDIIISSRLLFNKWLSQIRKNNVLRIAWEHNHHNNNQKFIRKTVKYCKNLDYLVNVSYGLYEFYRDKLSNYPCKSVFIPNMIEVDNYIAKLDSKNIVSIGRVEKEKGFLDLIDIFYKVWKQKPECRLNIVGDGSQMRFLRDKIKKYGLEKVVFLHGFRDTKYINNLLRSQSLYVMTSYTESFGIVLIEAMNKGIPCVAYDSAQGATEIIVNNKNGYLISDRNEDMMVKKIVYLLNNDHIRNKMGKKALENGKKYVPEVVIKKWEQIINKEI